jgi:hypothetical protein
MPAIVEYLTQKGGTAYGQYFVPNNTGSAVPVAIQNRATSGMTQCDNVNFKSVIQKGDSFFILAAGFVLPESFMLSTPVRGTGKVMLPKIKMFLHGTVSHKTYYPQMAASTDGSIFVPFESFEAVLNSFIDVNYGTFWCVEDNKYVTGIPESFDINIKMDETNSKVSMTGVPDSLNGTTQEVICFLKIAHDQIMTD